MFGPGVSTRVVSPQGQPITFNLFTHIREQPSYHVREMWVAQVVSQQVAPPQHAPPCTRQGSGSPLPLSRVFVLI